MGRKRFAATLLLTALALGATTAAAGASSGEESQFVSRINAERSERGLGALSTKSDLVAVARRHSARMAAKGTIFHNDNLPNEVDGWTVLGENVGVGPSVEDLHQAFMDSPGHRANVLEDEYNQVGLGVVITEDGTIYVTEVFARRASGSSSGTTASQPSSSTPKTAAKPAPRPSSRSSRRESARPAPAPARRAAAAAPVRSVDLLLRLYSLDSAA